MEIWKDVKEFEGHYQVSNLGNVRSIKFGKILPIVETNKFGYKKFMLRKPNYKKIVFTHRVVAECFINNPLNKPFVNHKNSIKNDNNIENLEWCTASENLKHSFSHGKNSQVGERNAKSKLTSDEVYKIKFETDGMIHSQIAKIYNIHTNHVGSIKRNERWSHIVKTASNQP